LLDYGGGIDSVELGVIIISRGHQIVNQGKGTPYLRVPFFFILHLHSTDLTGNGLIL
jgi:hypothetical protein